ncbi:alpha/beta fold hydrolase [Aerosakkonemataceae cyanobacterium BLCC-F154]|uniref:Alpha/beta fold hydrolase n=1 Tax=Floridaenema fluviatile BLCC-F154 TaxID=3153640 RepID=A0ABV4YB19_9CYAN
MHSKTIATHNGNIHILEVDAPVESKQLPVVFVHGMACSADIWDAQLAYAARTRRAIAIDLRGHGTSTPPADDDYSPVACATDLLAVLKVLKLDQIVLVGHSYGACVVLAAAAAKPHAIAQLILVDPPIDCTQFPPEVYEAEIAPVQAALATEDWRSTLENSFRGALTGGTSATHDQILARLAATPKAALLGTSRGLFAFKAVEALDRYLATPGAQAHAILAPSNNFPFSLHVLRPTLTITTLPDTGHWLMLDAPELFAGAIETCLAVV